MSGTPGPAPVTRRILGLELSSVTMQGMVGLVESWIDSGERRVAYGVNANVVNMAARRPDFARLLQAQDVGYADGQSVVWAARSLGLPIKERVATTDLASPLAAMCARRGVGIYLLGSTAANVRLAAQRMQESHPRLVVHHRDGYFDAGQNQDVVDAINASGAKVLLVGLGDPEQQQWVRRNLTELRVNAVLTCGGLFDWLSGANPRPPQWLVDGGLEWAWRVIIEPRRLLVRYLIGNPEFLIRLALEHLRVRRQNIRSG